MSSEVLRHTWQFSKQGTSTEAALLSKVSLQHTLESEILIVRGQSQQQDGNLIVAKQPFRDAVDIAPGYLGYRALMFQDPQSPVARLGPVRCESELGAMDESPTAIERLSAGSQDRAVCTLKDHLLVEAPGMLRDESRL